MVIIHTSIPGFTKWSSYIVIPGFTKWLLYTHQFQDSSNGAYTHTIYRIHHGDYTHINSRIHKMVIIRKSISTLIQLMMNIQQIPRITESVRVLIK